MGRQQHLTSVLETRGLAFQQLFHLTLGNSWEPFQRKPNIPTAGTFTKVGSHRQASSYPGFRELTS